MDDFKIAHRPQITSLGEMSVHPLSPSLPSFFLIRKRKKKKAAHGCIFISASDKCFMCQDDSLV